VKVVILPYFRRASVLSEGVREAEEEGGGWVKVSSGMLTEYYNVRLLEKAWQGSGRADGRMEGEFR
jgi:hypothetical protein